MRAQPVAGASAQREAERRALAERRSHRLGLGPSLALSVSAGAAGAAGLDAWIRAPLAGAGGLVAATAAWRVARRRPDLRSGAWAYGAAGERMTADCLAPLLRRGFVVLHDRRLRRGGNVDHIVIGPPGVYVIETKHVSGVVRVGRRLRVGRRRLDDAVEQSWREAVAVEQALGGVPVIPLLCFQGAEVRRHWWRVPLVGGVWVGSGRAVARYLRRQRRLLSPLEVDELVERAERVLEPMN